MRKNKMAITILGCIGIFLIAALVIGACCTGRGKDRKV